jgi:hypothetical protein
MAILTPMPANFDPKIRSALTEALQLSGYNDIIPAIIHLRVTQANTTTPGFDTFRMPGDFAFACYQIRGHIAINSLTNEVTGAGGLLDIGGTRNRVIAKALNMRFNLNNPDRDDMRIIETDLQNSVNGVAINSLCLATLLPMAGGAPMDLINDYDVTPLIINANERMKLTAQQAVALGANDQQTEYGLVFMGALARARG